MTLTEQMQALSQAVGEIVHVGCYPHRDDWFANCDGEEWQGPTPEEALASVRSKLLERYEAEARRITAVGVVVDNLKALRDAQS